MQIIRGKINCAQKIVVYGPEGIGKSSFLAKFPNPLFIDTEGSTARLDVARFPRPTSWAMLLEQVAYIKKNPTICGTLCIDTGDWAERLCVNAVCDKAEKNGVEDFGYGKGYVYVAEEFGKLLNTLEEIKELGINIGISAHAKITKFDQPDELGSYDRWEMKMGKHTTPLLKEWADMILFANYKTIVVNIDNQGVEKGKNKVQGGKRVMYTTHHPCWDAKNRHDLMAELDFDYSNISHCFINNTTAPLVTEPTIEVKESAPREFDAEERPSTEQQTIAEPAPQKRDSAGVPKPLFDLMVANNVTIEEIQKAVAERGYYPIDTPISKYDDGFINGVLVGAWEKVFEIIKEIRQFGTAFPV